MRLHRWSTSGGPVRRGLYYSFGSHAFARETAAVTAGIRTYQDRVDDGFELYQLRRHIHMLEKGLTMQPRRDSFALDYIESTVSTFCNFPYTAGAAGAEEHDWAASVLDAYFEATATASAPEIARARANYQQSRDGRDVVAQGPHEMGDAISPLAYEQLAQLAHARRSVRWYLPKEVDSGIIDRAVEVAVEAPTACNRQPYVFYILNDKETVAKAVDIPMGTRGYGHQIPGLAVIVGDLSAFFDERDRHLIYVDGCLAAMSFVLAMEAQGVATCCINWPDIPEKEQAMAKLLDLQPYQRVVMLVAFGYADPQGMVPRSIKGPLGDARKFVTL
ncbi:Nitroreductase [Frankineae bacterium MT45]|nr:Nitroreductase [Frankineae bacterium MT45]